MTYIERTVYTLTSTTGGLAGTTTTIAMPREHFHSRWFLRLTIGNSTTANFVAGAQNLFISRLAVVLNGQLTIKNYSWLDLFNQNTYLHGATPDQNAIKAAITGGFSSNLIEFATSPNSTTALLPSHLLSTLDLQIDWAAAAVLGGDTGVVITLEVLSRELINEGQPSDKLFLNKETTLTLTPTATGETAGSTLKLPIGNLYRRFYMITYGGASAAYLNTTATTVTLQQDGVYKHRVGNYLMIRTQDAVEYSVPVAERITGVAFLDLDMTENYSQCVDTSSFSTWDLIFNVASVTSAPTIRVIPQELIAPQ